MNEERTVFAQLMEFASHTGFQKCVRKYHSPRRKPRFSCWDQVLGTAFAQVTYRESLRDIEACLGDVPDRLYHMGFRGRVSRSTLADANEKVVVHVSEAIETLVHMSAPALSWTKEAV